MINVPLLKRFKIFIILFHYANNTRQNIMKIVVVVLIIIVVVVVRGQFFPFSHICLLCSLMFTSNNII